MAEKVLNNLQKGIVDSTIATAAGLEKESSFPTTHPALSYYQSAANVPFGYDGSESDSSRQINY